MKVVRHVKDLPKELKHAAVAIGNFDGLHLGHRAVLNLMKARADALKVPKAVLTFEPHPRKYFNKDSAPSNIPGRLSRISDKLRDLREAGVEIVYVMRFNQALAELPAEQFIHQVLSQTLGVKDVTTGDAFVFGKGRLGNVGLLKAGAEFSGQFTANAVPATQCDKKPISSTRVREVLAKGDVAQVPMLLGRPYTLNGRVVHGDAKARKLGYPTANIHLPPYLAHPAYGVYVVEAHVEGEDAVMYGVANVGVKPTFGERTRPVLEVHLLDRSIGLYGKKLMVEFLHQLRPEKKFESVASLAAQIARDAVAARAWFHTRDNPEEV